MKRVRIIGLLSILIFAVIACNEDDEQISEWVGAYSGKVVASANEMPVFQDETITLKITGVEGKYYDLSIEGLDTPEGITIGREARFLEVTDSLRNLKGWIPVMYAGQELQLESKLFMQQQKLQMQMSFELEGQLKLEILFAEE